MTIEMAMKKLRRMKVAELISNDGANEYQSEFDCVWWSVLREYDRYVDGEVDEYDNHLIHSTALTTYKWLVATQDLTIEFKNTKIDTI